MLQSVNGGTPVQENRDIAVCPFITLQGSGGPPRSYGLTAVIAHRGNANSGHFVVSHLLAIQITPLVRVCSASGCWSCGLAQRVWRSGGAHDAAADVHEAAAGHLRLHVKCCPEASLQLA